MKFSSKQSGNNTGSPRDFKVQYKIGAGGTWTDISGTNVTCVLNNWAAGALTDIPLPSACEDQASVYLRWIMTSNTSISGGTTSSNRYSGIDDILVVGTAITGSDIVIGTGSSIITYFLFIIIMKMREHKFSTYNQR